MQTDTVSSKVGYYWHTWWKEIKISHFWQHMTKLRVAKSELTFISFFKDFWTFCHPHDLLTWFPSVSSSKHVTTSQGSGRSTSPDFLKNFYINLPSHCWSVVWCFQFFLFREIQHGEIENQNFFYIWILCLILRGIILEFEWQTKDFEQITDKYTQGSGRSLEILICLKNFYLNLWLVKSINNQVNFQLDFQLFFFNCCCCFSGSQQSSA